jgi:hypothetical protein
MERERGTVVTAHDFDLAPANALGERIAGQCLERGLLRGEPGREVLSGQRTRERIIHFIGREQPAKGALAFVVDETPHPVDVDQVDTDAGDHARPVARRQKRRLGAAMGASDNAGMIANQHRSASSNTRWALDVQCRQCARRAADVLARTCSAASPNV